MNLLPPARSNLRGTVIAGVLGFAAVACTVASAIGRPVEGRTAGEVQAAAGKASAPADTGIVIDQAADGRLETWVDLPNGQAMIMRGPPPATGWTGFAYRYPGLVASGGNPLARAEHFATVLAVAPGAPGDAAGLRAGDELLSVNGVDGREPRLMSNPVPGTVYALHLRRDGEERDARLVVGAVRTRQQVEESMRASAACMRKAAATPGREDERSRRLDACAYPQ